MAKAAAVRVPGDAPAPSADAEPKPKKSRARASADAEPAEPPVTLPPAIERAVAAATHMKYDEAVAADREGKLTRRVLTEKGWYCPARREA